MLGMENRKFWYCGIEIKGVSRTYSYISDLGELETDSYVQVPFGGSNKARIGIVKSCGEFSETNAPYPPEQTKHITRIATKEEYLSDETGYSYNNDADDFFDEVNDYIAYANWPEVMRWAEENHESIVPEVIEKVMECYRLCMKQNIPEAFLNLGTFYYNGIFVPQDYKKAFELYKVAADAGVLRAICNCGYCFYYGKHQEVDYAEAFRYFEIGALLYNDPNCLYKLGDMYLNGYHVEKNDKYAFRLFDRALSICRDNDDAGYCLADTQFRVGKCLLYGIGVDRNIEAAHTLLNFAQLNFYKRRQTDPFVQGLIANTKKLIQEAQRFLDAETIN